MTSMSIRGIAKTLGVSPTTAHKDIRAGNQPDENGMIRVHHVMGLDGKVRPSVRFDTSGRDAEIRRLRAEGATIRKIADATDCSVGTVHRVLKKG